MRNVYLLAGGLSLLSGPLAFAQTLTETRYGATVTSVRFLNADGTSWTYYQKPYY